MAIQSWKNRSKIGRPQIFGSPEIMWDEATKYFKWCDENPFLQAEQIKGNVKPQKNDDGDLFYPSPIVSLPRMRPYTIHGLCLFLDVNTKYFNDFMDGIKGKDDEVSKMFSEVITRIRETIYDQKFSGAASGFFQQNIIARDLGLVDKKETEFKGEIKTTLTGIEPPEDDLNEGN